MILASVSRRDRYTEICRFLLPRRRIRRASMTDPGDAMPTAYAAVGPDDSTAAAPTRWRQWATLALKIGIAIGIVAWLSATGRLNLKALLELKPSWALGALLVLTVFSLGLPVWRWWWLLKIQQLPISMADALRLTWLSYLSALILPGAAGGDAVKAYLIIRGRPTGRFRAMSTVIVDRLLGLYSLTFLAAVPVAWWWFNGTLTPGAFALAGTTFLLWLGGTATIVLMSMPTTRRMSTYVFPTSWREAMDDSWLLYQRDLRGMTACFLISLLIDVVAVVSFAVASAALSLPYSILATFLAGPLAIMANGIPLTPGGAGVGEAACDGFFASLDISGGAESMLLVRLVTIVVTLPAFLLRWHGVEHRSVGLE